MTDDLSRARRIADAVLYEGYVLYPYRASSRKNRYRWTFGVVAPRAWSEAGGGEASSLRLECLLAAPDDAQLDGLLRFLHVEKRQVEALRDGNFVPVESLHVGQARHVSWEEGLEREYPLTLTLPHAPLELGGVIPARATEEPIRDGNEVVGRVIRTQRALQFSLGVVTTRLDARLVKLAITVDNTSPLADAKAPREDAVASALVGAHLILSLRAGEFVSLLDPPPHARMAAAQCANAGLFPVLAGEPGTKQLLLASPIVLYDHPEIAAESPGETCDGTEIDELLALSTRSLTDDEKQEARATSPRAAAVLDRAEQLSAKQLLGLHGKTTPRPPDDCRIGCHIGPGSRVRVRLQAPTGPRRTDAQDMFLDGRIGVVEEVREDFDGATHVAIVLEDDPAADLHRWYGRHLHFHPDELELLP